MKSLTLPVLALVLICVGCGEPCPHYYRTSVVSLVGKPTEIPSSQYGKVKPYGSVQLFQNKEDVKRPYEVIAIMSVSGNAGEEAKFINAFEYRAADLGADAIIFYRGTVMPNNDGSYRAEAICFKPAQ